MYYIGSSGKNRAMSAGRLSIMAFQIVRPLSYPGESDVRSSPRMFSFSSLTAVSVISDLPLEVTTCKFRGLDGEASRVIKRFLRIRSKHEGFRPSIRDLQSEAYDSRASRLSGTRRSWRSWGRVLRT